MEEITFLKNKSEHSKRILFANGKTISMVERINRMYSEWIFCQNRSKELCLLCMCLLLKGQEDQAWFSSFKPKVLPFKPKFIPDTFACNLSHRGCIRKQQTKVNLIHQRKSLWARIKHNLTQNDRFILNKLIP